MGAPATRAVSACSLPETTDAPKLPRERHCLLPARVGPELQDRPLHTNKFYTTLFLAEGTQPVYAHPYVLRIAGDGGPETPHGIEVSYSAARRVVSEERDGRAEFYFHTFEADVALTAAEQEAGTAWRVDGADEAGLGATVGFGAASDSSNPSQWQVPVVRGMPYVTASFADRTPVVRSVHAILRANGAPPAPGQRLAAARLRLELANGQVWLLYVLSGTAPTWQWDGQAWSCAERLTGTVRLAWATSRGAEDVLDRHARSWATGADVRLDPARSGYTVAWRKAGEATVPLLHCAQSHHLATMQEPGQKTGPHFESTTKGPMTAVAGDEWSLRVEPFAVDWLPPNPPDPAATPEILERLREDLAREPRADARAEGSNYFAGKVLFRFAQAVLVADGLGEAPLRDAAAERLALALADVAAGRGANPLVYDEVWRGVVGRGGLDGDKLHDFGNSYYNDHHYHWGYFLGAAAVARRFAGPLLEVEEWISVLIRDVANPSSEDTCFPLWRSFDWFSGHCWSQGLFESADGKDQESVSEEAMFHYGALLWGLAVGDHSLAGRSRLMLSVMLQSVHTYFLMRPGAGIHPEQFARNKVTGIFFENKVHHTTWFSPRPECIHGIQMLPVTPVNPHLRPLAFVEEEWQERLAAVLPGVEDGWKSLLLLNMATLDPRAAFEGLRTCPLDNGVLRSWALFWAATRQQQQPLCVSKTPATLGPVRIPDVADVCASPPASAIGTLPVATCDASLVGPPGGTRLRLAVRPADAEGVSLVAVHYSVNGGAQCNYDITAPAPSGDWVHNGLETMGAPGVSPSDSVDYWLYLLRRGLGEEARGLSWRAPPGEEPSTRPPPPAAQPPSAPAGYAAAEAPTAPPTTFGFVCDLSLVGPGSTRLRLAVRPADPRGVSLVAVHYRVNGGPEWNHDIRHPDPSGEWVFSGLEAAAAPAVAAGDVVGYWVYALRGGLGEEERGRSWTAA